MPKFTKEEVKYKKGKPDDHCGPVKDWGAWCVYYKVPYACRIVAGIIDPGARCIRFEAKKTKEK